MKKLTWILTMSLLCAGLAQGALRFGLGNAVAKRGAELINKAGSGPSGTTGDSVASTLPDCPAGAVYDSLPTDLSMIGGIDPLGHVSPAAHTLPADHIYYYSSTTTTPTPPVYSPAQVHVTEVDSTQYLTATPVFTDYTIVFYACKDLRAYYGHVRTLSAALQSQLGTINQNCSTYSTGGTTVTRCSTYLNSVFQSGDLLGYVATSGTLDYGTTDDRITPLAFISPARHPGNQPYTVCPIDYYTDGPKAAMQAKLGRFDGGYWRVTPPLCGQILFDIAGTAKGDWYHPGSPDIPEDPHLALIDNNVYAPQQTISVGTSLPNLSPAFFTFIPTSSGHVNRDFSQVTADATIYCYDTFYDPVGQLSANETFLIQVLTATTLRIEKQAPTACGAGPWAFTGNAVDFQR